MIARSIGAACPKHAPRIVIHSRLPHNIAMSTARKIDVLTQPSPAELKAVEEGREDIAEGRYIDHETMTERLRAWRKQSEGDTDS